MSGCFLIGKRVILTASAALLLLCTLSAAAAPMHCPIPSAVHYDQSKARFIATDATGLIWRSAVMPTFIPSPTLIAEPPTAFGSAGKARVTCFYRYATYNSVVLSPEEAKIIFSLADPSAWTGDSASQLFICKTTNCQFTRI